MRWDKPGREAVTSGYCRTGKTCFGSTGTSCDLLRHQSIEPLVAASRNVSVRVEDADHVLSTTVVRRERFEGADRAPGRAAEVVGPVDAGRGLEPLRDVRLLNVLIVGRLLLGGNLGEVGVWPEQALREFERTPGWYRSPLGYRIAAFAMTGWRGQDNSSCLLIRLRGCPLPALPAAICRRSRTSAGSNAAR
jgi:hypothetical protein